MINLKIDTPLISVLTTAYNRDKYIAEAIESVLASSYKNFELIIVDDYSTDKTLEIAERYEKQDDRIAVYANDRNLGDYPNRNKAASYAKGKYIKYLDSDDVIYPHGLEVMVKAMEQFPEAGFGLASLADPNRPLPICIPPHQAYLEHFGRYGHFNRAPSSSIIKRESFEETGGFSGKRMIGDFEMWFALGRKYPLVRFQRDLVWDRTHPDKELFSKYAENYGSLRKEVLEGAFLHPDCPLSKQEIVSIKRTLKKKKLKNYVFKALSRFNR